MSSYTIIQYYGEQENSSCGYCKNQDSSIDHDNFKTNLRRSTGIWLHFASVEDYQDLIDRGWRRCGCYCYKPLLHRTCCPMYTISCSAMDLKLTKSQKKVIKRMNSFINSGDRKKNSGAFDDMNILNVPMSYDILKDVQKLEEKSFSANITQKTKQNVQIYEKAKQLNLKKKDITVENKSKTNLKSHSTDINTEVAKSHIGKAKVRRLERKRKQLAEKGFSGEEIISIMNRKRKVPHAKSLEEFLYNQKQNAAHLLEVNLILQTNRNPPSSDKCFNEEYELYKLYQQTIHNDPEDKCTPSQYRRFLVSSPLEPQEIELEKDDETPPVRQYGTYHQHYRIDGKLVAVAVLDILPKCISSVYFFYNPLYRDLTLGTYSSFRELALTRELNKFTKKLRYYYMGYYINTCKKMKYKGNIRPSYLLCPETYTWWPIEHCKAKLDISNYSRFNDDKDVTDTDVCHNIQDVLILYDRKIIEYSNYAKMSGNNDSDEVKEYANLVGAKCARRMLLYRES